ncbi:hypothetical protein F5X68DRAFT_160328 [Plectosphaerella plurivora]|uniref:Uncharacterized protein n=1 Tax=Plectosphaerella plurivora TaxID=936078 RepID=A0A9P8V262_9PEZI|nr:hypothetical protein F5X68DRAFT_160328 [Plectosphaerella plurivora]
MAGPAPPSLGGPLVNESNIRSQKQQTGLSALADRKVPVPRKRNPLILPTDDDWKKVEGFFLEILRIPSVTTGAVLSAFFDDHDRTIFVPVTSPPTRVDVQKDHIRRYRINLATRFRGHPLTLASKFTMLYFGLPVEPLLSQLFDPMQHIVEETDDSALTSVIVKPPLHFLSAYDQRNFGIDSRRGREARFSTVPVQRSTLNKTNVLDDYEEDDFQLSLRGGDLDEHLDDASDEEPEPGLRGGEIEDSIEDTPSRSRGAQEDVEMGDVNDVEPVVHNPAMRTQFNPYILGYQGRCEVSFKDYAGIFDAIRCLLSVKPEVTTDIVLHKLENDKITITWRFPDPITAYEDAIICIQEHTKTTNPEFFIHRIGEQHPVEGCFKPSLREDDVFKLQCISRDRNFREAYLRLPPKMWFNRKGKPAHTYGANEYMTHVHVAQSVLFGQPRSRGDLMHSMIHLEGYTHGSDELTSLAGTPRPGQLTTWPASYGNYEIDKGFLDFAHMSNDNGPLSAMVRRRDLGPHQIMLIIPGAKIPELIIDTPLHKAQSKDVLAKMRKWMWDRHPGSGGSPIKMSLLFHHGKHFYSADPPTPYRWRPFINESRTSDEGSPPDAEVLQYLCDTVKKHPKIGRYFFVQPEYTIEAKIYAVGKEKAAYSLNKALTSMESFQEMLAKTNGSQDTLSKDILLRQVGDTKHWNLTTFTITERTTVHEMHQIRRFISTPNVQYEVIIGGSKASDFARGLTGVSQSLFGPRYGMIGDAERRKMDLKPLLKYDDPWLLHLRKEWVKKKEAEAAAAADAVDKQRREAEQKKELTGAAEKSIFKQFKEKAVFNKHLPKKDLRLQSWSRPQSLYDGDGDFHPYIPLNSAPIESMLRVSKGSSVPMVSKGVLTPSEQRDLQLQVHALRNLNLLRTHICQYQDCNFSCRTDDTKALLDHQESHVKYRCPWCPDTLFEHYHEKSRDKHFREKHADKLARLAVQAEAEGLDKNELLYKLRKEYVEPRIKKQPVDPRSALQTSYSVTVPRPGGEPVVHSHPAKAHSWEKEYSHCDRCGRNHGFLDNKADRAHHDRLCVPHAKGAGVCGFCKSCGEREWATEKDAKKWSAGVEFPHSCRGLVHAGSPHCGKCGVSMQKMTDAYIDKHRQHCMGYGSMVASFCPYCADPLNNLHPDQADPKMWLRHKRLHMIACRRSLRPNSSQRFYKEDMTPFDLYDQTYWAGPEPPHDDLWNGPHVLGGEAFYTSGLYRPSKYLGEKLEWYEMVGEKDFMDPPKKCPSEGCPWAIGSMLPNDVLNHFEEYHGGPLKMCPLCNLSFKVPAEDAVEGGDRYDCEFQEKHMECHVFSLWDIRDGKKEKPKYDDFKGLRNKAGDAAAGSFGGFVKGQCPFFDECGAIITQMSDDQWETHVRQNHPSLAPRRDIRDELQAGKRPATGSSRLKSPPPPAPTDDDEDEEAKEAERAWLRVIIGDVTVPNELHAFLKEGEGSYFCSRCFRPFSKGHYREDPGTISQFAAHLDINNRSCRIPNVKGQAMRNGSVILPNQTGWIPRDALPKEFDLELYGKQWEEMYPSHKGTIFEFNGKGKKWNTWSHDPNCKQKKKLHSLPYPPIGWDPIAFSTPSMGKSTPRPPRSESRLKIKRAPTRAEAAAAAALEKDSDSDEEEEEEEEEGGEQEEEEEEDTEYVQVDKENEDEDEDDEMGGQGGDDVEDDEEDGVEDDAGRGGEDDAGKGGEEEEEEEEESDSDEEVDDDDAAADPPKGSGKKGSSKKDTPSKKTTKKGTASEQEEESDSDEDEDEDEDDNDGGAGAVAAVTKANTKKRRRWRPITYKSGRRKGPPRSPVEVEEEEEEVDSDAVERHMLDLIARNPAMKEQLRRLRRKHRRRVEGSYRGGDSSSSSDSDINSTLTGSEEEELGEIHQWLKDHDLNIGTLGKRKRRWRRVPQAKMAVMGDGSEVIEGEGEDEPEEEQVVEELVEGERSPKRSRTASE